LNKIEGNYVGTNAAGTGSVGIKPNGGAAGTPSGNSFFGVEISGGNHNTVGGASASDRNVVGFNAAGIEVDDGGQNNVIQGNYSGVGADGATPIGNNLHGIVVRSDGSLPAPLGPGQVNEPAVSGNIIGLNPATLSGLGNLVESSAPVVKKFELINPTTQAALGQLNNNAIISLSALHVASLDIASFASPAALSTTFVLNGVYEGLSSASLQTLLDAEHSKTGLGVGKYTLTVQAFSQKYANGAASNFASVHFQIVA
jgi:hypothetical protein